MVTTKKPITLYGKSTDEKPTEGIPNGSMYIITDPQEGVIHGFIFDEEAKEWNVAG